MVVSLVPAALGHSHVLLSFGALIYYSVGDSQPYMLADRLPSFHVRRLLSLSTSKPKMVSCTRMTAVSALNIGIPSPIVNPCHHLRSARCGYSDSHTVVLTKPRYATAYILLFP